MKFKYNEIVHNLKIDSQKYNFWYAIYFSVFFSLFYNPLNSMKVTKFNRIIGDGIIADVDVVKRIRNFNILFVLFILLFILFFLLISNLRKCKDNIKENKIMFKFLDNYIVLANLSIILKVINSHFKSKVLSYSFCFIMFIFLMGLIYICMDYRKNIKLKNYAKIIIIGLVLSIPISILIKPTEKGFLVIQFIIFILELLIIKFRMKKDDDRVIENIGIITISFIPLIISLFFELLNILNQHKIFVGNPQKWFIVLMIFMTFIFFVEEFVIYKRKIRLRNWKKIAYPILILGITSLSVQLPLQQFYYPDMYESANSSVLISDFFNFGSIPIIEHYGGHMMTDVWEGIIYGILNKDIVGASLSPYSIYFVIVLSIIFFYFMKEIWNEEMAFITTLIFPFYSFWSYFGLGVLIYFNIKNYIKRESYQGAILLWLVILWCILYRMDLGYAFGLSAVLTIFIYVIKYKQFKNIKKLSFSLVIVVIFCLIIWLGVCINKKINPIDRMIEFLKISLSNQNWAYTTLGAYGTVGDINKVLFAWIYLIIPFFMIICLFYTIFLEKIHTTLGKNRWLLLIFLEFSYFLNFSRGLVRHSLVEYDDIGTIWTAWISIALFLSCIKKNKKYFLVIFSFLIFLNMLFFEKQNFNQLSIIENMNLKLNSIVKTWTEKNEHHKTLWEDLKENKKKVERVVLGDKDLVNTISEYKIIIDNLLKKDETYVDFINKTFLYSMLGRKNPAYISQSPLQLSGEFTQEQFIKQIKGVPVVFMPSIIDDRSSITLDGITNNYRNYKVAEYLYKEYQPLIKMGEKFSVWCLKEKCGILKEKAKNLLINKQIQFINFGYDSLNKKNNQIEYIGSIHNYDLEYLPYIWANYDTKKAINNRVLSRLISVPNNRFLINPLENNYKIKGNYLLITGNFKNEEKVTIKLGNLKDNIFSEKYKYNFIAKEGTQNYLLRVSTDYYWYTNEINSVEVVSENGIKNVSMKILEGD